MRSPVVRLMRWARRREAIAEFKADLRVREKTRAAERDSEVWRNEETKTRSS